MTVAAARKQQKEVDIVLKKVEDGMEEFAYVWDQGIRALGSSSAQKEKLGEELKKSINKLQRLRVQIREWIGQTDLKGNIKDKLEEARRKIEADMTRFKEFERELKTKAFSSNALAKGDGLGLEGDAETLRWQEWLTSTIQQLNDQREEFEADLELLSNKKNLSSSDKERIPELRAWQDTHEFHIHKMELILRALDNEAVDDLSDLDCIKDGVEFYLESHMEPNYMHDEALYDYIDLSSFEEEKTNARTPSIDVTKETPSSKEDASKKGKEKDRKKKEEKKDKRKDDKKAVTPTPLAGKVVTEAVITSTKQVVPAPAKEVTAAEKAPPAVVVEHKPKEPVVRSIVDDFDENEEKVQADQLTGDAEEFICKICQVHVVGCSPKLTNCSHLFCGDCLAQWFAQHPESQTWAQRARSAGPERVVPCPVCKQPLNEKKDLHPVCGATSRSENLLLWRMLSSLKIVCMNSCQLRKKDGRCDWVGEYGQYQKHAKACKNLPMAESGEPSPTATETVRETPAPPPPAVSRSPVGAAPQQGTPVSRPEASPVMPVQPATAAPSVAPSLAAQAPARSQEPAAAPTPVGAPPRTAAPTVVAPRVQRSQNPPQPPQPPQPVKLLQAAQTTTPSTSVPSSQSTDTSSPVAAQPAAGSGAATAAKAPDASAASSTAEETQSGSTVVATCAFEPTGPNMMQVRPGDLILVLERHASGWAFCKNLSSANGSSDQQGWAPSWIAQSLQSNEDKSAAQASQAQHSRAKEPETRQAAVAAAPTPQHSQGASASQGAGAAAASPAPAAATASSASPVQQQPQQQSLRPAATAASAPESASTPASTQAAPKAPQSTARAAIAPFSAATASQLSLALGDLVEIVERDASGWTYGRKAQDGPRQTPVEGWFPDWCTQK